ncbi:MAG: phosphohydrolase, partial [Oscillospiraceae bacterium]
MLSVSAKDLIIQISDCLDAVERGLLGATRFHSKRVALFSIYIAKGLGYDKDSQFAIAVASLLHDNALTEYILSEG